MAVFLRASACAAFDDIARGRHDGTTDLRLKTISLFDGQDSGRVIDSQNQIVSELKYAQVAMISAHAARAEAKLKP